MSFEYIEIKDKSLIPDCVDIHAQIFNLSDKDAFPSSFFNMLIRKEHPLGIIIGCFKTESYYKELIGLLLTTADAVKESLYCVLIGMLPEYQNGRHGYNFALKLREVGLERGFKTLYGIYDPLEANLGKLYSFIGGVTTKYISEPYLLENDIQQTDKVLFEWHFNSNDVKDRLENGRSNDFYEYISKYPIHSTKEITDNEFLFEIPNNYIELQRSNYSESVEWREKSRSVLKSYINNKGYSITNCISGRVNGTRKTFYLLSNKLKNELLNLSNLSNN